jgi:chromosome segregation ATPase
MKNRISQWLCFMTATFVLSGFGLSGAWAAADAEKEAKHEMRKIQAQLSEAQKEKAELAAKVEELKKQLGEVGAKSAVLEKKTGGQKKQFAELTEKFQESESNLQKMTLQYSETKNSLLQVQKEKEQLQKEKEQEQKRLSGDVQVCEKKNDELYRISVDIIEKYRAKGVFTALMQAEPFTQLESVRMQNLMQEYKDKTNAAKLATTAKADAVAPAGVASASPSKNGAGGNVAAGAPVKPADNNVQQTPQP